MSLWKSVQVFAAAFFKERAAALTSKAGLGQLWVKNDTPCTLQFTDDAGTDIALGSSNVEDSTAAGQLLFGDATGGYDHTETSEIVWDDANKRLGIDKAAPNHLLDLGDSLGKKLAVYQNASNTSFYGFGITAGKLDFYASDTGTISPVLILLKEGYILTKTALKITVSTATYTLNESNNYPEIILHVTRTAAGTCTITIDTDQLSNDSQITIKDAGGGAATYNITIQTEGAEIIDGAATAVISGNYDSLTLYNDNTNWFIK